MRDEGRKKQDMEKSIPCYLFATCYRRKGFMKTSEAATNDLFSSIRTTWQDRLRDR